MPNISVFFLWSSEKYRVYYLFFGILHFAFSIQMSYNKHFSSSKDLLNIDIYTCMISLVITAGITFAFVVVIGQSIEDVVRLFAFLISFF
jgi:hypothetical protein